MSRRDALPNPYASGTGGGADRSGAPHYLVAGAVTAGVVGGVLAGPGAAAADAVPVEDRPASRDDGRGEVADHASTGRPVDASEDGGVDAVDGVAAAGFVAQYAGIVDEQSVALAGRVRVIRDAAARGSAAAGPVPPASPALAALGAADVEEQVGRAADALGSWSLAVDGVLDLVHGIARSAVDVDADRRSTGTATGPVLELVPSPALGGAAPEREERSEGHALLDRADGWVTRMLSEEWGFVDGVLDGVELLLGIPLGDDGAGVVLRGAPDGGRPSAGGGER